MNFGKLNQSRRDLSFKFEQQPPSDKEESRNVFFFRENIISEKNSLINPFFGQIQCDCPGPGPVHNYDMDEVYITEYGNHNWKKKKAISRSNRNFATILI